MSSTALSSQCGFTLHTAGCCGSGAFARELQDAGLLSAGVVLCFAGIRESFILLTLLPITISWIYD